MIFALGFLAASLCGLLVLPAVNARAARLSRRRAEASLPLSPAEIAAERDFLRAQFAVQQRRLERTVETVSAKRHADMAAIGAGTMKAAALAHDVAARDGEIAAAQAKRLELEVELAGSREDGTASLATLLALEEAHADLLDSLLALRQGALVQAESEPAIAIDPTDDLRAERDDLRASLAAAEAALARALGERSDGVERENADLRRRIAEVADALTGRERLPRAESFPIPEPARV